MEFDYVPADDEPAGDIGSPVVLDLWPAQHCSPIHSHGNTTGIIHCLAGRLDVMEGRRGHGGRGSHEG